jgi:hypothetical protein
MRRFEKMRELPFLLFDSEAVGGEAARKSA